MINWLQKKIRNWVWSLDEEPVEVGRNNRFLETSHIRIDIYRGEGGLAVETTVYNKKRDENMIGFHIVHDDEQLGERLSKIITVESIKSL